jgi:hypothetical protein
MCGKMHDARIGQNTAGGKPLDGLFGCFIAKMDGGLRRSRRLRNRAQLVSRLGQRVLPADELYVGEMPR